MSLIVVSAILEESSPSLALLEKQGVDVAYHCLGVGPLHAAKAVAAIAAASRGKRVIYIGSAGSYAGFDEPYLVTANRVLWSPSGERFGLAERPDWLYGPLELEPPAWLLSLAPRTVLTSTGITIYDGLPPRKGSEACVENMELYACCQELRESAREFAVILGITNQIGSQGREQWLRHRARVAAMTAEYIGIHCL